MERSLNIAKMSLAEVMEVLNIREQYFRHINDQGMKMARHIAFLVEKGHEAVFSESYCSVRTTIKFKMEVEAAEQLTKARIERTSGKQGDGPSGAAEDE